MASKRTTAADPAKPKRLRCYRYSLSRSQAPEHQTPGVNCFAVSAGDVEAASIDDARAWVEKLCFCDGTWELTIEAPGMRRRLYTIEIKTRPAAPNRKAAKTL